MLEFTQVRFIRLQSSNLRFLEIKECPFEPHNQVEIKERKRAKQGAGRGRRTKGKGMSN